MLGMTACGVVKSMTASNCASIGAVRAEALRIFFLADHPDAVSSLAGNIRHHLPGLAPPQH